MHEGCRTIKFGSTTCWNYNDTCDGSRILDSYHKTNGEKSFIVMSPKNLPAVIRDHKISLYYRLVGQELEQNAGLQILLPCFDPWHSDSVFCSCN